jgi:hypothetical protein
MRPSHAKQLVLTGYLTFPWCQWDQQIICLSGNQRVQHGVLMVGVDVSIFIGIMPTIVKHGDVLWVQLVGLHICK